jgi:hypothetical protein
MCMCFSLTPFLKKKSPFDLCIHTHMFFIANYGQIHLGFQMHMSPFTQKKTISS